MAELDLYGVFVSPLLVLGIIAFALDALVRRGLSRFGWYRAVWHPALFNLSVFVILLGALVALHNLWTRS